MPLPRLLRVVVLPLLVALPGCRSMDLQDLPWPSNLAWLKNLVAEREEVTYYPTARENFHKGMAAYEKEEWQDAGKYFDYVRTRFPHSRYATVAELRLADAHFGREKWLDSIDAYRAFARLHPAHDAVPYASFQVAKAYYRQIPEDWFFLPATSERDQSAAQDAVRAFDDFLIRFPDHDRAAEARKLRKEARERLAAHEWYVAGYYLSSHPRGAAFRYERIADLYPDVDNAPLGLFRAAGIWEKEKELARARVDYERVARDYPKDGNAAAARKAAARLAARLDPPRKPAADVVPAPAPAAVDPAEASAPGQAPTGGDAPPPMDQADTDADAPAGEPAGDDTAPPETGE